MKVLVQVPQRGCVITWDFDILKGDLTFTVFKSRRSVPGDPHEHHISGATGGIGSTQYIDKHMQVGKDLSIVEPPLVCRDGDSIQVNIIVELHPCECEFLRGKMWFIYSEKLLYFYYFVNVLIFYTNIYQHFIVRFI